ncbi:MAG: Small subunit (SSU) processome component [Thelocarpon superellum]|nr:MAG: Small subunit (SSU) processome component [Thelocarpon superellum]
MVSKKSARVTSAPSTSDNTATHVNGGPQATPWHDRPIEKLLPRGKVVAVTNGPHPLKAAQKSGVDESQAHVLSGDPPSEGGAVQGLVELSSDPDAESSSELDEASDDEDEGEHAPAGTEDEDHIMTNADVGEETGNEAMAEPSFGDLIHAAAIDPIDVEAVVDDSLAPPGAPHPASTSRSLSAPLAASLSTVLMQALRTNDVHLLESCLHTTDLDIIRSTVERLDSSLATTLLHRLADRLHRRPGRAGNLMVWVQWTLIAHGGYLASQPELMAKLTTLHRVIQQRASGLQSLLALKGKLDMLEAQMELRRRLHTSGAMAPADDNGEHDDAIIYVEGQEEEDDDDDGGDDDGDSIDDDADVPTTVNGVESDSADDSHGGGSEEASDNESEDGLLEDEAEETEDDTGDDESGGEASDGQAVGGLPAAKRRSVARPNGSTPS